MLLTFDLMLCSSSVEVGVNTFCSHPSQHLMSLGFLGLQQVSLEVAGLSWLALYSWPMRAVIQRPGSISPMSC